MKTQSHRQLLCCLLHLPGIAHAALLPAAPVLTVCLWRKQWDQWKYHGLDPTCAHCYLKVSKMLGDSNRDASSSAQDPQRCPRCLLLCQAGKQPESLWDSLDIHITERKKMEPSRRIVSSWKEAALAQCKVSPLTPGSWTSASSAAHPCWRLRWPPCCSCSAGCWQWCLNAWLLLSVPSCLLWRGSHKGSSCRDERNPSTEILPKTGLCWLSSFPLSAVSTPQHQKPD